MGFLFGLAKTRSEAAALRTYLARGKKTGLRKSVISGKLNPPQIVFPRPQPVYAAPPLRRGFALCGVLSAAPLTHALNARPATLAQNQVSGKTADPNLADLLSEVLGFP
jgi:hypothetical protein